MNCQYFAPHIATKCPASPLVEGVVREYVVKLQSGAKRGIDRGRPA